MFRRRLFSDHELQLGNEVHEQAQTPDDDDAQMGAGDAAPLAEGEMKNEGGRNRRGNCGGAALVLRSARFFTDGKSNQP
jgi:hypothetical protein